MARKYAVTRGCTKCGWCVQECPVGAITMDKDGAHINADECTGCGRCYENCPSEAIEPLETRDRSSEASPETSELRRGDASDRRGPLVGLAPNANSHADADVQCQDTGATGRADMLDYQQDNDGIVEPQRTLPVESE